MTNQQRKWNDVDNKYDAVAMAEFAYLVSLLLLPYCANRIACNRMEESRQ